MVSLVVNDRLCSFELDTGASSTIIGHHDWCKLGKPSLQSSKLRLTCYSGKPLTLLGECNVNVKLGKELISLSLVVVSGTGPALLGLEWIHALKLDLNRIIHGSNSDPCSIHRVLDDKKLSTILDKYKSVLSNELGHCTKVKAHIELQPDATPRFFKPRPLPFAYLSGVKEELDRQVNIGILEKVDTSSWAAPIVPVKKPNGRIRICGDFKVTINPQICIDQHPIPTVDELLAKLQNGQKFTKLDLSDAYLQLELDEPSKPLVVINTPFGLFRYNRMPFGIANAPAIFQRTIDQVISGIPNCVAYLDDILITGVNDQDHLFTLELVFSRLLAFGLTCNPDKCHFFQTQVSYLGFVIDANGKRPDLQRVEAITNMPSPKNVKELEAFIGKVNYYGKFLSNFSAKCEPLNRLRRHSVKWNWSTECQVAFDRLKADMANATTLVHFDPKLPLILATDASNYGIGAVILHRDVDGSERPIAHASKTLTSAEQKYSQIEKEALSIVYGVKKFNQYLIGRRFELCTDHQPLLTIFSPSKGIPLSTANRLQRWALCLMGYTYVIRYKPTLSHANADALSRLPAGADPSFVDKVSCQVNLIQSELMEQWPVKSIELQQATDQDECLRKVKEFTQTQWPRSFPKQETPDLLPYFNNRHSLSIVNGCLLKDTQVVIPLQLRRRVLHMLHRAHLGTVKMKQLARSHCWWPNLDKDIVDITRSCLSCEKTQPLPRPQFQSWQEPPQVWSRVHMDFAGPFWNSKWLLLIDAKSKFPLVVDMNNNTTATALINALDNAIDWFGPPHSLVSDNGPPFNSSQMKQFYEKYNIDHITTPPYHPASNGIIERLVRSFKESMVKQQQSGETNKHAAVRNFLRTYRWTPHTSTNVSPAELMFHHPIRTALDMMNPKQPSTSQPRYYSGQLVWARIHRPLGHTRWQTAIVAKNLGSMVYDIILSKGVSTKCHENHLRPRYSSSKQPSETDSLPDDLLKSTPTPEPTLTTTPATPAPTQPRRNPRRDRRPPVRYTPP